MQSSRGRDENQTEFMLNFLHISYSLYDVVEVNGAAFFNKNGKEIG